MSEDLPIGERSARKLRERNRIRAVTRTRLLRELMGRVDGREFIWDLLTEAKVFAQTFVPGAPDITAFQEGQRSQGLKLLAEITSAAPRAYMEMTAENSSVKLEEDTEDE